MFYIFVQIAERRSPIPDLTQEWKESQGKQTHCLPEPPCWWENSPGFYNQQKINLYFTGSPWYLTIYVWNCTSAKVSITFAGSQLWGYLTIKHQQLISCRTIKHVAQMEPAVWLQSSTTATVDCHYNFYKVILPQASPTRARILGPLY